MSYLEQLAALAKKKSRDESGRAVRGVVEWWRGDGGEGGGAPSRKLRAFADQPGLGAVAQAWEGLEAFGKGREQKAANAGMTREELERVLVVYAFEDWLKKWFFSVLQALEVCLSLFLSSYTAADLFSSSANVGRPPPPP